MLRGFGSSPLQIGSIIIRRSSRSYAQNWLQSSLNSMNRPVRTGKDFDEARARILEAAEKHFRRVGYHRTSVADIAAELGMSPANIYRFFPSRDAINESIYGRVVNEVTDIAVAIARTNAPATEKLDQLLTAVHRHNKTTPVKAKYMHNLIADATRENWGFP